MGCGQFTGKTTESVKFHPRGRRAESDRSFAENTCEAAGDYVCGYWFSGSDDVGAGEFVVQGLLVLRAQNEEAADEPDDLQDGCGRFEGGSGRVT